MGFGQVVKEDDPQVPIGGSVPHMTHVSSNKAGGIVVQEAPKDVRG
jgi:hypothetical protein